MALAPELIDAYENADYVVFTDPELVLRIGEPSPRLDALLEAEGATAAAYITAANPRGELKTAAENESAGSTPPRRRPASLNAGASLTASTRRCPSRSARDCRAAATPATRNSWRPRSPRTPTSSSPRTGRSCTSPGAARVRCRSAS